MLWVTFVPPAFEAERLADWSAAITQVPAWSKVTVVPWIEHESLVVAGSTEKVMAPPEPPRALTR